MEGKPQEQIKKHNADHMKPWLFKPGKSGNPGGRPKGSISLKEFARKYLSELNEKEKIEFMKGLDKSDIWRMAEGNPDNKNELIGTVSVNFDDTFNKKKKPDEKHN